MAGNKLMKLLRCLLKHLSFYEKREPEELEPIECGKYEEE